MNKLIGKKFFCQDEYVVANIDLSYKMFDIEMLEDFDMDSDFIEITDEHIVKEGKRIGINVIDKYTYSELLEYVEKINDIDSSMDMDGDDEDEEEEFNPEDMDIDVDIDDITSNAEAMATIEAINSYIQEKASTDNILIEMNEVITVEKVDKIDLSKLSSLNEEQDDKLNLFIDAFYDDIEFDEYDAFTDGTNTFVKSDSGEVFLIKNLYLY